MTKFTVGSLALSLMLVAGCGNSEAPPDESAQAEPAEVAVLKITPREQMLTSDLPGRVVPLRTAEVRARVAGIVQKRHFTEGVPVNAGDLLFTIDPAPLEAAVARAKGAQARSQAKVVQAQSLVNRYEPLVKIEAVSKQEYDNARADLQSARADLISAQAEVKTAQLDLSYATVRAPIAGRIGKSLASEGSLVGQGEATPMALIQQIDPIYADFTQPASAVLRLRQAMAEGRLASGGTDAPVVKIRVDGAEYGAPGKLLFADISVDQGTGQVTLRGEFPNPDSMLLPGMFVQVNTEQGIDKNAIFVPQRAIQRGTDGAPKVMIVSAEGKAEERPVKTGTMQGKDWQILDGLKAGDQVIVQGVDKITAGMPVKPAAQPAVGAAK